MANCLCGSMALLCGFSAASNRGKDLTNSLAPKTQQRFAIAAGVVLSILCVTVFIHQLSHWIKNGASLHDRRIFLCASGTLGAIFSIAYTVFAIQNYKAPPE